MKLFQNCVPAGVALLLDANIRIKVHFTFVQVFHLLYKKLDCGQLAPRSALSRNSCISSLFIYYRSVACE